MVKMYGEGEYYHCYNRGVNRGMIFHDTDDYGYFLSLFRRHLSHDKSYDKTRRPYPHYTEQVELVAYCLMPNHYHLLLFLKEKDGIKQLMRSVMTAYSTYFNKRYARTGKLFEGHFLASRIASNEYLWHVSRYIHLNPLDVAEDPMRYAYSSVAYFGGAKTAQWLHPEHLIDAAGRQAYIASLEDEDNQSYHKLMHALNHQLAQSPAKE